MDCSNAQIELSKCGHDKTCEQLAACQSMLDRVNQVCQALPIPPDAGIDAPAGGGHVTATILQPAIATELLTTNPVMVTVQAANGYAGLVDVSLVLTTPIAGWGVAGSPTTLTLATDGSATATFEIVIPSDSPALSNSFTVAAVGPGTRSDVAGTITAARRITIDVVAGTGTTVPHPSLGPAAMTIRSGTELRITNSDSIAHPMHGNGGLSHQQSTMGLPGQVFTQTVTASGTWQCHDHEDGALSRAITVIP